MAKMIAHGEKSLAVWTNEDDTSRWTFTAKGVDRPGRLLRQIRIFGRLESPAVLVSGITLLQADQRAYHFGYSRVK